MYKSLILTFLFCFLGVSESFLYDWIGWGGKDAKSEIGAPVTFEELEPDLKFIEEASKIAGIPLSELDVCEQKIILKLKNSCGRLNDEQLARLSVNLLNCQNSAEGRKVYPCTDEMTLKDCTSEMPPEVWNAYHVVSNRARAVCYAARQQHFRAYAENVVNKLVESTRNHLTTIEEFQNKQKMVHAEADLTLEKLSLNQRQVLVSYSKIKSAETSLVEKLAKSLDLAQKSADLLSQNAGKISEMNSIIETSIDMSKKKMKEELEIREKITSLITAKLTSVAKAIDEIFNHTRTSSAELHSKSQLANEKAAKVDLTLEEILAKIDSVARTLGESHQRFHSIVGPDGGNLQKIITILPHVLILIFMMILSSFLNFSTSNRWILLFGSVVNFVALEMNEYRPETYIIFFATVSLACIINFFIMSRPDGEKRNESDRPDENVRDGSPENHVQNRVHSWLEDQPSNRTNGYHPTHPTPSVSSSIKTFCRGHTRNGAPCRNVPKKDGIFCFIHS